MITALCRNVKNHLILCIHYFHLITAVRKEAIIEGSLDTLKRKPD